MLLRNSTFQTYLGIVFAGALYYHINPQPIIRSPKFDLPVNGNMVFSFYGTGIISRQHPLTGEEITYDFSKQEVTIDGVTSCFKHSKLDDVHLKWIVSLANQGLRDHVEALRNQGKEPSNFISSNVEFFDDYPNRVTVDLLCTTPETTETADASAPRFYEALSPLAPR